MNFQQQPQFGFSDSQNNGLMPSTLDTVNPGYYGIIEEFVQKSGGRLASLSGIRLYDTYRVDRGVMPQSQFVFFANGVSQTQGLLVAGTQYKKNNIDTSFWIDGGKLSNGYDALITSMQLVVLLPSARDETIQTSGNSISLTNDPGIISGEAATDAVKAGNLMRAILEGLYLEFFLNNSTYEHGNGLLFPSQYGPGNYSALVGTVAAPGADGLVSNTVGYAYQMPILRHIPAMTRFGVRAQFQNAFDTTNSEEFRLMVVLEGVGIQPVTG